MEHNALPVAQPLLSEQPQLLEHVPLKARTLDLREREAAVLELLGRQLEVLAQLRRAEPRLAQLVGLEAAPAPHIVRMLLFPSL